MFYVYKITNLINGKVYIGQTGNISKRWNDHKRIALNQEPKRQPIHHAIKKYGVENFNFEIIENCKTKKESFDLEIQHIENSKSFIGKYGDTYGYNLTIGGDGNQDIIGTKNPKAKLTEDQVAEIKTSLFPTKQLAEKYNVGRTVIQRIRSGQIWTHINVSTPTYSPEYLQEIANLHFQNRSLPRKGKKNSEESIKKMSKSKIGMYDGENNPNSILNSDDVRKIRMDYAAGDITIVCLAKNYNVSESCITSTIKYKTWKYI